MYGRKHEAWWQGADMNGGGALNLTKNCCMKFTKAQ